MARSADNLVWIDCEMTGLDPKTCVILEIAAVITNSRLNIVATGPDIVISHSKVALSRMNAWNRTHHRRSGLLECVAASKVSIRQAEQEMLKFIRKYCYKGKSPLCGNSISHDRAFLAKYMPELHSFFHYQNIDVSSIKQLVERWYPREYHIRPKNDVHRALADINESIEELRHYMNKVFVCGE